MTRKKQSDDLDLTPFIGLFAMLVVLLLVTASWSKLYSFKTKFSKSVESFAPNDPQKQKKKKEVTLKIMAYKDRLVFVVEKDEKKKTKSLRIAPNQLQPQKIKNQILRWSQLYGPEKQITIESVAEFQYGTLIEVYDHIFGAGMEVIAISTSNLSKAGG